MKRFVLGCFLFLLKTTLVFAQVSEAFNDTSYKNTWQGNHTKWILDNGQLRSNSETANDTFYLSTPSTLATIAQWEFYVNLKFNTSGTNYTDIFLVCDVADIKSNNKNGYFVRIGGTSDEICLYRRRNGTNTKLIDGVNAITNKANNTIRVKVTRSVKNVWTLKRDITGTGFNYVSEGTAVDSIYSHSNYFGILVRQSTATFHKKHFFDDIQVKTLVIDSIPPQITTLKVISPTSIALVFNEYVDVTTSENPDNYILNNSFIHPETAVRDIHNPKRVILTFSEAFADSVVNTLVVSGIQDFEDNVMPSTSVNFTYYAPIPPSFKDVIINEIFADPSPSILLPEAEFVEIYNNSNKRFSLKNWQLGDLSSTAIITTEDDSIYPGEYLIICSNKDSTLFKTYGRVLAMNKFPTLNNSSDVIYLKNHSSEIVDSVGYTDSWYKNTTKKQGGWTLELISPDFNLNCPTSENWIASINPLGGTPGAKNSVYRMDVTAPVVSEIQVLSPEKIAITLSEIVDTNFVKNTSLYVVDKGVGNPIRADINPLQQQQIVLNFYPPLQLNTSYSLTVKSGITDCFGNMIHSPAILPFAVPQEVEPNDLVINELLSNPKPGGVDFIEIYNRSQKIIDLKIILVAEYDTVNQVAVSPKKLSNSQRFLFPQEYLVISKSMAALENQYIIKNISSFVDVASMPKMNIASGAVCLLSSNNQIIDVVKYNDKMHYPLIKDTKGVSLERIDFNQPSGNSTNWHSASQNAGFATPGYENSQYVSFSKTYNELQVYPELFSPDEDGMDDVLGISYNLKNAGYTGSISIYDSRGRLVRELAKNELLGVSGTYFWDGTNNFREKARIGIYIIFFEAFSTDGDLVKHKKVCVIGGKI
jgi:hypothetical protein